MVAIPTSSSPQPPTTRARRSVLRIVLRWFLIGIAIWLIVSTLIAYTLTHRMQAPFEEPTPELPWGKVEPLRLTTSDGEEVGAWYVPGRDDGPSVVLMHGNGGHRGRCLSRANLLAQRGCSVLLLTARAHGDSTGNYNDFGYSARLDVIAAVELLEEKRPGKPVLLLGMSLGSAASAFAARELGERVSGCFLEMPYRDLRTATRNRARVWLPPVLDYVAYLGLITTGQLFVPHLDRVSPLDAVTEIPSSVPVWILVGDRDEMARPVEAEAIYERVQTHGGLVVFPGAEHESLLSHDAERYTAALDDWLRHTRRDR